MFGLSLVSELKKSDKQEVDVTICYYHLEDNKDRYVFFFYDPSQKSPIYKWAYYLIDENYKDLRKQFNEVIKEKNFRPNRLANICMCNKSTKINTLKLPKTLKYSFNYKSIITEDLKDKMGSDVKSKYYIDNQVEGAAEKKAEQFEKKVLAEAGRRKAKVQKYKNKIAQEEYEYKYEREHKESLKYSFLKFYIAGGVLSGGLILAGILLHQIGMLFNFIYIPFISIIGLYLLLIPLFIIITKKKFPKTEEVQEKKRITYKNLMDLYYIVSTTIFFYGSELLAYFLYLDKISEILKNIYGIFIFLYILSIAICERIKRKNLSKLCQPVERKPREKRIKVYQVEEDEDDEELFESGMNENKLFNMSHSKVKITKSKKSRSVVVYRQLLVPKEAYKAVSKTASSLHFGIKSLRTLPSLIASFHRKYSKGVNEIVAYNEANFTLLVGFVNDQIIDCMFIDGAPKAKNEEGFQVGLHLSSFRNVFSSMLWECQRETSTMDRVVYISNTPKNITAFKKENLFGLPYELVHSTDIIFGESARKVKSLALLKSGFTLIETVVAIAVFAITSAMVASLALGINRFNRNQNDTSKANVYINNLCEVLNYDQSDDTTFKLFYHSFENNYSGHYFINSNFGVYEASNKTVNNTYRVDYKMDLLSFNVGEVEHYHYTLTIKKISRIGEQRNIVPSTKIEVVRWWRRLRMVMH